MNEKFYTYTQPRPFFGYNIPIAIQSSYLREYSKKKNFLFMLPITEIVKNDSYYMFKKHFSKNKINLGLTSIFMLPLDNRNKVEEVLKNVNLNSKFHFVLENLILKKKDILLWQKNYQNFSKLSNNYKSFHQFIKKIKNK